jgi:hypothetical protein
VGIFTEKGVPVTSIHRNAKKASPLGRWVNSLCHRSAEGEAISLHARIEKLDLEQSISDGLGLPDQLIQSLFGVACSFSSSASLVLSLLLAPKRIDAQLLYVYNKHLVCTNTTCR